MTNPSTQSALLTSTQSRWQGMGEQSLQAGNAALGQIKTEVARRMFSARGALAQVFGVPSFNEQQIAQMASDWVDNGTMTVNGTSYDRQQLGQLVTQRMHRLGLTDEHGTVPQNLQPQIRRMFGLGDNIPVGNVSEVLSNTLPDQNTFISVADEAAKAVDEPWYMQLLHAVKGFFSWMFSGFQGNISDHIYGSAADSMSQNFGAGLSRLRAQNPLLGALLPESSMNQIVGGMRDAIANAGSGQTPAPVTVQSITQNLTDSPPQASTEVSLSRDAFSAIVRTQIARGMEDQVATARSGSTMQRVGNWMLQRVGPGEQNLDRMSTIISNTMYDAINGENRVSDEVLGNQQQFSQEIKRRVEAALRANQQWSNGVGSVVSSIGGEYLAREGAFGVQGIIPTVGAQVEAFARDNHAQLLPMIRQMRNNPPGNNPLALSNGMPNDVRQQVTFQVQDETTVPGEQGVQTGIPTIALNQRGQGNDLQTGPTGRQV